MLPRSADKQAGALEFLIRYSIPPASRLPADFKENGAEGGPKDDVDTLWQISAHCPDAQRVLKDAERARRSSPQTRSA